MSPSKVAAVRIGTRTAQAWRSARSEVSSLFRRTLAPVDVLPLTGVRQAPSPPSCANMQHRFQCCAVRIKFPSSAATCQCV
jgi:hypothetical protein